MPPRPPQDGRRGPQKSPRTAQEGLKTAQEAPETAQEGPRTGPRLAQEKEQEAPRGPREASRTPPEAPNKPAPKTAPKRPQNCLPRAPYRPLGPPGFVRRRSRLTWPTLPSGGGQDETHAARRLQACPRAGAWDARRRGPDPPLPVLGGPGGPSHGPRGPKPKKTIRRSRIDEQPGGRNIS